MLASQNQTFLVDAEITVWCESIKRGCTFAARMYCRTTERHYSGSGDTALEAVAWCLDDYVRRGLLGHGPSPAIRSDTQPGDGLTPATSSRPRRITPAPIAIGPVLAQEATRENGCFERSIPTQPAPRLHHELVLQPETTTRRARGGRR
jgi:hypothetical protein